MLSKNDLIVFDEFTSVVDRNVAKIGSYAVQKAIEETAKSFGLHERMVKHICL